jgi:hypothetical protein
MTRDTSRAVPAQRQPMIRSVFQRKANAITCELARRGPHSFELYVVPHWAPASAVIERFDIPEVALARHAQMAQCLRENGWMVIDRVAHKVQIRRVRRCSRASPHARGESLRSRHLLILRQAPPIRLQKDRQKGRLPCVSRT